MGATRNHRYGHSACRASSLVQSQVAVIVAGGSEPAARGSVDMTDCSRRPSPARVDPLTTFRAPDSAPHIRVGVRLMWSTPYHLARASPTPPIRL